MKKNAAVSQNEACGVDAPAVPPSLPGDAARYEN
jgi:hypothetical protein